MHDINESVELLFSTRTPPRDEYCIGKTIVWECQLRQTCFFCRCLEILGLEWKLGIQGAKDIASIVDAGGKLVLIQEKFLSVIAGEYAYATNATTTHLNEYDTIP